jgi:anti-sigma factor RsiW
MHEPIEQGLEDFLAAPDGARRTEAFDRHLAACGECRTELAQMREHQGLLREMRAPELEDPAPGFYARVMERIEAQAANSFWSILLEPSFGRRLMFASLALFVVLGSAVWQAGSGPAIDEANPVQIMAGADLPAATGEDPGRDRAVVLTNLVSVSEGGRAVESLPISSD